jgi:DNA repair protein RadC
MIVDTARVAAELLAPHFAELEGEGVAVLHLDEDRRLLATTFDPGGPGLPMRSILAASLRAGAVAIVVARNHSGDDAKPTPEELDAARALAEAGAALGVRLIDHLVFAAGQCRSFRELGLL